MEPVIGPATSGRTRWLATSPQWGEVKIDSRSRDAASHPSYEKRLSEIVTTGHSRSQNGVLRTPMPVVHADVSRLKRRWKRCASEAFAWIAGIGELRDAVLRTAMPGNDEGKERKKKSEAERRQTQFVFCRAVRAQPRLSTERRTSIGVPPRRLVPRSLSSQGTQLQARLPGTWRGHVLRIPLSGRYPPLPVPVQRAPPVVVLGG